MSGAAERAVRVRRGAGWFALDGRGTLRVTGADRARWTNGMLSNEVAALAPGPGRSGCHALLLTPQGRIVTDLHVLCRPDALWLELGRDALPDVLARLERYRIADDVELEDASDDWRRAGLEGPRAREVLERAAGAALALAPDSGDALHLAGAEAVACRWGWSGEDAYQLWLAPGAADAQRAALADAARALGVDWVEGDAAALEVLRVEAGTPAAGRELDEDVLPAETGLIGRAVSLSKGCYTGQEIVARMESRDAASHRLMGFRFGDAEPAPVGSEVRVGGERVGELTSAARSALAGGIGLGYVRRAHAAPDSEVSVAGAPARLAALPLVQTPS